MQRRMSSSPTKLDTSVKGSSGSSGSDPGGGVVQQVIREVGVGSSYPTLTKSNYPDWALLMKVKLKARGLWEAVDCGGADKQEDMMALDVPSSAVLPEMVVTLASKDSAKEACDAIKTMHVRDDRLRASMAQQLLQQFDAAMF
jgi:hypothetical protein